MNLLTNDNALILWRDTVKEAEDQCSILLKQELENYLVTLLAQYSRKPEIAKQVFATAFLEAQHAHDNYSLQQMGDQCLLFAGLFPRAAEGKLVKVSYFVDLGRSAYTSISIKTNDLFSSLAFQFVMLMDILQSIRPQPNLLPLEAYEQWNELGSQRALRILQEYTRNNALPK
jgi:hypothetical protein